MALTALLKDDRYVSRRLSEIDFIESHGGDARFDHLTIPMMERIKRFSVMIDAQTNGWQPHHRETLAMLSKRPRQELDSVLNLMYRLKATRQAADWPGTVYLVSCEDSRLYVGYTTKPLDERMDEHYAKDYIDWTTMAMKNVEWTDMYPFRILFYSFPGTGGSGPSPAGDAAYTDEDWLTLLLMVSRSNCDDYAIVRGGRWTSIDREPEWPTEHSFESIEGKLQNNQRSPGMS
jgi:hypothetical protein